MKSKVLLVDDEADITFPIRRFLEQEGFHVDVANELEEAEARLLTGTYDLLLTDMRLTGIHASEGLDLLRFARERSPETRTIVLTAYFSDDVAALAAERGAVTVLSKPVGLSELVLRMNEILTPGSDL